MPVSLSHYSSQSLVESNAFQLYMALHLSSNSEENELNIS